MQDVGEVLENHIWIGVTWREAFVVPFIPITVPGWSDACFEPVEWPSSQPRSDGDQGWCIVRSPATDADGWVYGTAFDHLREDRPGGRASKRANDRVRSRLWRRVEGWQEQQGQGALSASPRQAAGPASSSGSGAAPAGPSSSAAAGAAGAAAGQAVSAGKAAWVGAVHAVQTPMPGAVKRASFAGMVNTFLKLVKDAAARHNTALITPDITGWFFVISTHSEELKKQQLGQLQQLVWFSRDQKLQAAMQQGGLGTNPPGVVLQGAAAALAALEAAKQQPPPPADAAAAGASQDSSAGSSKQAPAATAGTDRSSAPASSSQRAPGSTDSSQHVLKGRPFTGVRMHIGSGSRAQVQRTEPSSSGSKGASSSVAASGSPAGVQLHVGHVAMLDDLLAGAQYSQAAYGYVAAAGHLSNLGNAIKMLATLPHFNAITGASLEANIRAMHTLAGFCPQDVLLAAWHNDTFRPCHYVAIDVKRGNIVLGVRGSLELGDLETDVTAAPLPFEFQGIAGWVHEGLLAAAAYVVSNTVDSLAEAAQRCPGWPLVVAGHSLGGGVAALVTLLLQQPGAAPRGISGVRCITIGPPAVLSQELCGLCEEYITSIVLGADPIPRLSTFSVESLLLDLVNMSLSRRMTNQLAATTSSMAASTAGAINSLAAGLSRLANTATTNMVSNVNSMKTSLASFKALPGFPLIDASLAGINLGLPGASSAAAEDGSRTEVSQGLQRADLYSAGTGSVELTRRQQQQQQQQWQEQVEALREGSDGGLKQVHVMLQDERQQQQRASMEAQRQEDVQPPPPPPPQQQQQQRGDTQHPAAPPRVIPHVQAPAAVRLKPVSTGFAAPPTAATQFGSPSQAGGLAGRSAQQQQQQQGDGSSSPASVPRWQKDVAGGGSSSKPGGARLVSGGPAAANIMIFPKHDDANIINGIQEAWAGLKPRAAAAAEPSSSTAQAAGAAADAAAAASGEGAKAAASSGGNAPGAQQLQQQQQPGAPTVQRHAATGHRSSSNRSKTRLPVTPFGIEQALPGAASAGAGSTAAAAAAAGRLGRPPSAGAEAGGSGRRAGSSGSSSGSGGSSSIKRCTSEPSLQQWASDGLEGLGEPSWVKLSRSSDGAGGNGGANATQQQQQDRGAGGAGAGGGGGGVGDSTVHALESDLQKTARLYPPGRIFWILSEELVGPAAHQLMTAVAAHLTPAAATAATAVAAAAGAGAKAQPTSGTAAAAAASSSGSSSLRPPSQAHMDMPTSLMGPGSKPILRTQPKQQQQQREREQAPSTPQQRERAQKQPPPLSSKTAARDAATAHAVAAASAKHILQDVHSEEARRTAAAALQAAQHEHPPLQLWEQQSPEEAAAQLEQQVLLQQQDLQAAEAVVGGGEGQRGGSGSAAAAAEGRDSSGSGSSSSRESSEASGTTGRGDAKQQKPLRTLRASASASASASVQMTAAGQPPPAATSAAGTAATPSSQAAASSSQPTAAAGGAKRSSSGPMEVDGSAAVRAAGFGWPLSWGSVDAVNPEELPQELQELIQILGSPCDAASALAIGYKKQVLLQHFWQQRQREASAARRRGTVSAGGSAGGSRGRSNSDSHLLKFEDMIRAVDDLGGSAGPPAAAAAAAAAAAGGAPVLPQLELVDHSWWGTISSLGGPGSSSSGGGAGGGGSNSGRAPPGKQQDPAAAGTGAGAAGGAAAHKQQQPGSSGDAEPADGRSLPLGNSHKLDTLASNDGSDESSAAGSAGGEQPQTAGSSSGASEPPSMQPAVLQEGDAQVMWAAQQAAQHQQQEAAGAAAASASAAKQQQQQQLSLPELAAESLVELAQLPERIAESFSGFKLGSAGAAGAGAADEAGCGELGPGAAAGLAALCGPMLNPTVPDGAAASAPAISTSGIRLPPVVVLPERDVFSRLLLHRTAVLDHLPSNYVQALTDIRDAFLQLQPQQQAQ